MVAAAILVAEPAAPTSLLGERPLSVSMVSTHVVTTAALAASGPLAALRAPQPAATRRNTTTHRPMRRRITRDHGSIALRGSDESPTTVFVDLRPSSGFAERERLLPVRAGARLV